MMALTRELARMAEHHVEKDHDRRSLHNVFEAAREKIQTHLVVEMTKAPNQYYLQQRLWDQDPDEQDQFTDYDDIGSMYEWPTMASGRCLPNVLTDSFIAMCYHQPPVLQLWNALLGMSYDEAAQNGEHTGRSWITRSRVTELVEDCDELRAGHYSLDEPLSPKRGRKVPRDQRSNNNRAFNDDGDDNDDDGRGLRYRQVFVALAARRAIALGLYRTSRSAFLRSGMPYTALNPEPETKLNSGDWVFYIQPAQEQEHEHNT